MKWSFLTNPFLWIGVAVVIVIVLIVLTTRSQRVTPPSTVCPDNKPSLCGDNCYDPSIDVCVDNRIICPTTQPKLCKDTCFDPNSSECIDDKVCNGINICVDEGNKPTCCNDNEFCTKQGKCVLECPSGKTCTGGPGRIQCCKNATDICTKSGVCCDPKLYTEDTDFCCTPNVGELCTDKSGKTTCCSYASGQYCLNGQCTVGCPNPRALDLYKCNNTPPPLPAKPVLCSSELPVCSVDCDKPVDDRYVCISGDECKWGDVEYSPTSLGTDPLTGEGIKVCRAKVSPTAPPTSQAPDGSLWLTSAFPNLYASVSTTKGDNNSSCGLSSCIYKIREKDSSIIVNDKTVITPAGDKMVCFADLDCQKRLIDPKNETQLKAVCDNLDGECCTYNGKYTGQVCEKGKFCADVDGEGSKCYNGFVWNPANYRCEPSNEEGAYNSVSQCIKNYCDNRPEYERSIPCRKCANENWRTCAVCPEWLASDSTGLCTLTYKMPPSVMHEIYGAHNGEDGHILLCVPSSCIVSTDWNGYKTDDYGVYKDEKWPMFWRQYYVHPDLGTFATDYGFNITLSCGDKSITYTVSMASDGIFGGSKTEVAVSSGSQRIVSTKPGQIQALNNDKFNAAARFGRDSNDTSTVYLSVPSNNYI